MLSLRGVAAAAAAFAIAVSATAGVAFSALEHQLGRQQREIASLQSERSVRQAAAAVPATRPACAYRAVQCVTVPGSGQYGLLIEGSRKGFGGIQLMVTDYNKAPEIWTEGGSLYVLARPGWIGGQVCVDVALKVNYCLSYRDIEWIHAHGG